MEWSSLPRFQRTRGVLRLMATVVHRLWLEGDRTLMILPACVPLGAGDVQSELARYLDDPWGPVFERDVDGPGSLSMRIDEENVLLGKVSAARRVARRWVVVKDGAPGWDLARLGLTPLPSARGAERYYARVTAERPGGEDPDSPGVR